MKRYCITLQRSCNTLQLLGVSLLGIRGCVCQEPMYEKIPQHTATHCNTLQHTATHCNCVMSLCLGVRGWGGAGADIWKDIATHCQTLQHSATHCNTLQLPDVSLLGGPRGGVPGAASRSARRDDASSSAVTMLLRHTRVVAAGYIYIYIYLCIYMYICVHMCICICVYMYI